MDLIHWLYAKFIYGFVVRWLETMTGKCETKWSPTEDQIDNIIIPAMQGTAQQYAKYASELQCPPSFIALMLWDIADTFQENRISSEKDCDCCQTTFNEFTYQM